MSRKLKALMSAMVVGMMVLAPVVMMPSSAVANGIEDTGPIGAATVRIVKELPDNGIGVAIDCGPRLLGTEGEITITYADWVDLSQIEWYQTYGKDTKYGPHSAPQILAGANICSTEMIDEGHKVTGKMKVTRQGGTSTSLLSVFGIDTSIHACEPAFTISSGVPGMAPYAVTPAPTPHCVIAPEPEIIEVTPVAPTLVPATECGVRPTVQYPTIEGVDYLPDRNTGDSLTVGAYPQSGYKFPEGAVRSWTFDLTVEDCPEPEEPTLIEVIPVAPTLVPAEECGVRPTVSVPETEGIYFTMLNAPGTPNGVVYVTNAKDGYKLAEGAKSRWVLDLSAEECPEPEEPTLIEVTPVAPTFVESTVCGVAHTFTLPEVEGVRYSVVIAGPLAPHLVSIVAHEKDGYTFPAGTQRVWAFNLLAEKCPIEPEPEEPVEVTPVAPTLVVSTECGVAHTVDIPNVEGVIYTQTRDGDFVTVTAAAAEGYAFDANAVTTWEFNMAAEECPIDPVDPVDPEPTDPVEPEPTDPGTPKPEEPKETPKVEEPKETPKAETPKAAEEVLAETGSASSTVYMLLAGLLLAAGAGLLASRRFMKS